MQLFLDWKKATLNIVYFTAMWLIFKTFDYPPYLVDIRKMRTL